MNKKKIVFLFIVGIGCLLIVLMGMFSSDSKSTVIYDEEGEQIAVLTYTEEGLEYSCEENLYSFVDVVVSEAIDILMKQEGIKEADAQKRLVEDELQISTTFRKDALENIIYAYEKNENLENCNFATVLGGVHGEIYACFSVSALDSTNMALEATYPASALKPLSVYGQAIEADVLYWSDKVLDAPYESKDKDGNSVLIPANATTSSNEEIFIEAAVKESLNTVPIRILKEYGVENSCNFLFENFEISLDREFHVLKNGDEDDILANVALGYINAGISPKDLFGYYQVFANGGTYQSAYTILKIEKNDQLYYQHEDISKEVFSEDTAYIVNRLLKQVVSTGGTGADAQIEGFDLCGKTGTSNNFEDNWFVGMTPEYIGVVWYGMENLSLDRNINESVIVYRDMVGQINELHGVEFVKPQTVVEQIYCKKTGMLAGEYCEQTDTGYYKEGKMPEICTCH